MILTIIFALSIFARFVIRFLFWPNRIIFHNRILFNLNWILFQPQSGYFPSLVFTPEGESIIRGMGAANIARRYP